MLQCPKFNSKVLIWTYMLIDSRETKLCVCISCKTMGSKRSQITFLTKLLALDWHTLPMETEPWVLSKIMLSFLLCRRSAHVREKRMKKISFVVIHFISAYIFSANLPVRILFVVSVIYLEYAHNLEKGSYWEILLQRNSQSVTCCSSQVLPFVILALLRHS